MSLYIHTLIIVTDGMETRVMLSRRGTEGRRRRTFCTVTLKTGACQQRIATPWKIQQSTPSPKSLRRRYNSIYIGGHGRHETDYKLDDVDGFKVVALQHVDGYMRNVVGKQHSTPPWSLIGNFFLTSHGGSR